MAKAPPASKAAKKTPTQSTTEPAKKIKANKKKSSAKSAVKVSATTAATAVMKSPAAQVADSRATQVADGDATQVAAKGATKVGASGANRDAARVVKKITSKKLEGEGGDEKSAHGVMAPRTVHAEIVDAESQVLRARNVGTVPDKVAKKPAASSDPLSEDFDPASYESHLEQGPTDEELQELDQTVDNDDNLHELLEPKKASPQLGGKVDSTSKAVSTSVSSTDPVATYLQEIRKYGLLTREQEHELAVRYREHGDSKAAELLVTSNLRFVVKVAAEYSRFGAKLIDLIQEGNVGLMHAVREYNPYKGVKLITYAVWWIRGYIQEYLMRQYSMVRIGTTQNQRKLFYRLQKEKNLLESMGRDTNYALLSSRLGVSEDEVETMTKRLSGRDVSLSQPLDNGDSTATLLDFEESLEPNAERQIGDAEELNVLKDNLSILRPKLSKKETYLLDERILAEDPLTLQEIGEHYGVTREAVRQLEVRLIGKIRAAVTESLNHSTADEHDGSVD